jgi:hypothetical protein
MTAPDDLDGVAVLAALGPALVLLASGADPWPAAAHPAVLLVTGQGQALRAGPWPSA